MVKEECFLLQLIRFFFNLLLFAQSLDATLLYKVDSNGCGFKSAVR